MAPAYADKALWAERVCTVIRKDGLLSQSTLQKFRQGQGVSWENLETLCRLLKCQPADLIEYVEDETVHKKAD